MPDQHAPPRRRIFSPRRKREKMKKEERKE